MVKRGIGMIVSVLLVLQLAMANIPAHGDEPGVVIDPGQSGQAFEGWGTSLAWWGNAIGRWETDKQQEIIDYLFDEQEGLGLNIVRYNIGGGINPNELSKMRLHADVPSFQPEPGEWFLQADQYQRLILEKALEKGVDITEAFSNGPPYWMTYSKSAAGSVLGITNNLYDDAYDDFADYIVRVLKLYQEEHGIEFRTVAPLNEPVSHWWIKGNNQEGCHFDRDKQNLILKEVASRLRQNGLVNTQISANEEAKFEDAIKSFEACDPFVKEQLSQVNVHSYFGTDRQGLRRVVSEAGKRLWVSECGVGGTGSHNHQDMSSAMQLTRKILDDLKELSANGWLYWQAVEDEAGKNNWGFIHANFSGTEDYWLTKQYYVMKNYSHYIRPGCHILKVDDNDILAAYNHQSDRLVLVLTNESTNQQTKRIDLSRFSLLPNTMTEVVRTSASENAETVTAGVLDGYQLSIDLPEQSVTTVVLEQCAYQGNLKVNDDWQGKIDNYYYYNGDWESGNQEGAFDGDNHWTDQAGATYELTFEGKRILLYGAKDDNHGLATIKLDGQMVEEVDLYSSARQEASCYYDSGVINQGKHTIEVIVTGRHNPLSNGSYVTADYAEIDGQPQSVPQNIVQTSVQGNDLVSGLVGRVESQPSESIYQLTDGRLDTAWQKTVHGAETRLSIPFEKMVLVNEIVVYAPDSMTYKVQLLDENGQYIHLAQHSSNQTNNGVFRYHLEVPLKAEEVSLLFDGGQSRLVVDECKVFGEGYTNINDNTVGGTNRFTYTGEWQYYWFEEGAYQKDNHFSKKSGDSCELPFVGSSIKVYAAKDKNHGKAGIWLDGQLQEVVDYYASERADNSLIFERSGLDLENHQLEIKVLGQKNSQSTDFFVTIDRVLVEK